GFPLLMTMTDWFDRTVAPTVTPPRRRGSIRRTTSMEVQWPTGRDGDARIIGRGRDLLTPADGGAARVVADERLDATVTRDKRIATLATRPVLNGVEALAGHHALIGLRARLRDMEQTDGPLALLLDDMVGTNIISGWVWSRWLTDRREKLAFVGDPAAMANACLSYAPGSQALENDGYLDKVDYVPPLGRADDPIAFHPLQPDCDRTMRRVRRIDLWREGDLLWMDAMFQDSGVLPGTRRSAIHEYRLCASADASGGVLRSIDAHWGVLPHAQCRQGPETLASLPGIALTALRAHVLRALRGTAGCTHLNDAARSLAEMGALAAQL
ncbi:MAG: DUF2889 domain-containing protein, partial [Sphingobium sp.]